LQCIVSGARDPGPKDPSWKPLLHYSEGLLPDGELDSFKASHLGALWLGVNALSCSPSKTTVLQIDNFEASHCCLHQGTQTFNKPLAVVPPNDF